MGLADKSLQNTGLERAAALEKDIQWFQDEYGMKPLPITDSSPGRVYARCAAQLFTADCRGGDADPWQLRGEGHSIELECTSRVSLLECVLLIKDWKVAGIQV
jgi:hypothetical protein